jgi:glycosyltransferase involved in cell wall biosynthesis
LKKIYVVGVVGLPACYGGFETLVENLVLNKSPDISYEIFCSKKAYKIHPNEYKGARLRYIALNANGLQSIIYDIYSLFLCARQKSDAILILGLSGCIFLPILKLISKSKILLNVDGFEWRREKWGFITRNFLKLSESIGVRFCDEVIADNEAIGQYIKKKYMRDAQVIAYGGDNALSNIEIDSKTSNYSLALCRIEPENNVEMILEAFRLTNKPLKFVGNWDNSKYGRGLKEKYSKIENLQILDPVYDIDRLFELRSNAELYLHGHSAGGTNPSLVEMMHFKAPIFAFDCDFNRYTTKNMGLYFRTKKGLIDLLTTEFSDSALTSIATNLKRIACEDYTWPTIVKRYESLY